MATPRQLAVQLSLALDAPLAGPHAPRPPAPIAALLERRRRERAREALVRDRLAELLRGRLATLTFTRNRSTLLSLRRGRRQPDHLEVRLHRRFLDAPDAVLEAAARVCLGRRRGRADTATLRRWFDHAAAEQGEESLRPRRPLRLVARGRTYDLEAIRQRLCRGLFCAAAAALPEPAIERASSARLTWGTPPRRARRCHLTVLLGSYHEADHLVRIHPVLDQAWVPPFVVELVVYHELLHAALGSEQRGGRRVLHGPAFRRHERRHPRCADAELWVEHHLPRLLRSS